MPLEIIFYQILILSVLALAGVAGSAARVIVPSSKDLLAKIIFNITLPSLLLTNFSRIELTPGLLTNSLLFLLLAAGVMLFMLLAGYITSRLIGMKGTDSGLFRLHSMLGNIIYLGFPVIAALFGEEGLLYASIFTLVSNIFMWTVGVFTLSNSKTPSFRKNLLRIVNPNTIAIISGFILFLTSTKLPEFILDSVGGLGSTNTYLSMIYIGAVIWYAEKRHLLIKKEVWILSFNKLILVPFILMGMTLLANSLLHNKIDSMVASVLIMQSAMPCMVNVVIMINIFGGDDRIATANVFVSTILSIFTLPIILLMLRFVI